MLRLKSSCCCGVVIICLCVRLLRSYCSLGMVFSCLKKPSTHPSPSHDIYFYHQLTSHDMHHTYQTHQANVHCSTNIIIHNTQGPQLMNKIYILILTLTKHALNLRFPTASFKMYVSTAHIPKHQSATQILQCL